jgi:hypothetical protein
MRVSGDVGEGLFGDAIQRGGSVRGKAGGDSAVDVIYRNAFLAREFRAVFAQRYGQTKVVQHGRIQNSGEIVEVASQAGHAFLKGIRSPWSGSAGGQVCHLHAQGCQPLADVAVELRGHPLAFIFPLAEQTGRQVLQLLAAAHQGILLCQQGLLGHFLMRDVAGVQNNSALRIGDESTGDAFQQPPGAVSVAETVFA